MPVTTKSPMVCETGAVVTSTEAISILDWKDYLDQNWEHLMIKGVTNLLIITGIHGLSNGGIDRREKAMAEADVAMIKHLQKKHPELVFLGRDEIQDDAQDKTFVQLLDVGEIYANTSEQDFAKTLTSEITCLNKEYGREITMILLAYCHTNRNIVTDILRMDAFCSKLVIERDLFDLFGRRICLDEKQIQILESVRTNPEEAFVALSGDYGTGKTIMMIEMVKMKMAHYRFAKKKRVKAVVAFAGAPRKTDVVHLERFVRKAFAGWEEDVILLAVEGSKLRYGFRELRQKFRTMSEEGRLAKSPGDDDDDEDEAVVIYGLDEAGQLKDKVLIENWVRPNELNKTEKLVAVFTPAAEMTEQKVKHLFPHFHLTRPYRSSYQIRRFYEFVGSHISKDRGISSWPFEIQASARSLPELEYPSGPVPLWVPVPGKIGVSEIVDFLKQEGHLTKDDGSSIQFIGCHDVKVDNSLIDQFSQWKDIRGSEFETVVVFLTEERIFMKYFAEAITRARRKLIVVSYAEGSHFRPHLWDRDDPSSSFLDTDCQALLDLLQAASELHQVGSCQACQRLVEQGKQGFQAGINLLKRVDFQPTGPSQVKQRRTS